MSLTIGRRETYALRIVMHLAGVRPGQFVKVQEMAAAVHAARGSIAQVLADLVRAGILLGRAGRRGGYELARRPEEISVLDVIAAVGSVPVGASSRLDDVDSDRDLCLLHLQRSSVQRLLSDELRRTSIADLNAGVRTLAHALFPEG